jgi:hypothetical protein
MNLTDESKRYSKIADRPIHIERRACGSIYVYEYPMNPDNKIYVGQGRFALGNKLFETIEHARNAAGAPINWRNL